MSAAIEQARQYLAKLPKGAVEGDPELHEAIAHLSGVIAVLDEVEPQRELYLAAIKCNHVINDDVVKLYCDHSQPGNALDQLAGRLAAALSAVPPAPISRIATEAKEAA